MPGAVARQVMSGKMAFRTTTGNGLGFITMNGSAEHSAARLTRRDAWSQCSLILPHTLPSAAPPVLAAVELALHDGVLRPWASLAAFVAGSCSSAACSPTITKPFAPPGP